MFSASPSPVPVLGPHIIFPMHLNPDLSHAHSLSPETLNTQLALPMHLSVVIPVMGDVEGEVLCCCHLPGRRNACTMTMLEPVRDGVLIGFQKSSPSHSYNRELYV